MENYLTDEKITLGVKAHVCDPVQVSLNYPLEGFFTQILLFLTCINLDNILLVYEQNVMLYPGVLKLPITRFQRF